jgi:CheY-like chemotaxis protein/HPt (histidine-containing phosphotransfer) domain-containing protein
MARQQMTEARDQALQVARLKSEFLATMSHEIRTPMNGVIGMTELLLGTALDDEQKQFAETIQNSADGLLTIINDILDFSKLEAGKIELEERDFELRSLVEDVAMLFAGTAQAKGLELLCQIPPNLDVFCKGDPNRLRQVLMNLLGNAVKFTKRGEVTLGVTIEDEADGRHRARFEVRDTGIGMSPEVQARIFDSFVQADASTTRHYGGTGLGLAISSQLVELMGGEIRVESEPGRGSAFCFGICLGRSDVSARTRNEAAPMLRGLLVLVVDDNATNREILRHQLASWGMSCRAVEDGPSALGAMREAVARGRAYDLALLDMHMPGMDGLELARTIQSDAALAGVPLVMLSSVLLAGALNERRDAGLRAYLVKPVRQSELFDTLAGVLGGCVVATESTDDAGLESERGLDARVLLVEDNPVNQEVARAMLEKLGCEVDACDNGQEALDALDRGRYDAVLMDCQMPIMDGYEATAEIRRRESAAGAGARMPIIALTANAIEGDRERCLAADMDDYLSKPFRKSQLRGLLQRWLPTRSADPSEPPADADCALASESQPDREPAVDITALDAIRELASAKRPQLLADVVGAYCESSNALVGELGSAVEEGDAEAVRQAAHALKSGSRNVGARLLSEMCEELEMMGRAKALESTKDRFERLSREHRRVLDALNEEVPFKSS